MIIVVEELRAMFAVTPRDLSMSVSTHAFMDIRFMSMCHLRKRGTTFEFVEIREDEFIIYHSPFVTSKYVE